MRVYPFVIVALFALAPYAHAQTAGGTSGPAGSGLGATPDSNSLFNSSPSTSFSTGSSFAPAPMLVPSVGGVPNTSTPGIIGTDTPPSGLPGDDPQHPGFPAPLNMGR